MTAFASEIVASTFILFCRIGACLMLAPGFSSPRAPGRVRLFVALAVTLALAPALTGGKPFVIPDFATLVGDILSETLIGGLIGLLGRLYFLALETLMMATAMNIGLSNALGAPIDETEPTPPLAGLAMLTATCLIFIADLHWELIRGIVASYRVLPVGALLAPQLALRLVGDGLAQTFVIALRIASPFIVYALVINMAIGLINKMTPQIPVFFISGPFVIAGGLALFYFIAGPMVAAFMTEFANWALKGQ